MLFATLLCSSAIEMGALIDTSIESQEAGESRGMSIPAPTSLVDIYLCG